VYSLYLLCFQNGWEQSTDSSGRIIYVNRETNTVQYEFPARRNTIAGEILVSYAYSISVPERASTVVVVVVEKACS
jgi:hypothetical protein